MKFSAKTAMFASVAALGLGLAAGDGPREEAAEDKGEAMEAQVDQTADAMEDSGQISDAQEDAMKDAADDKADAMEKQGEAADEAAGQ